MLAKAFNSLANIFGYELKKIGEQIDKEDGYNIYCLLYTSPSPRD